MCLFLIVKNKKEELGSSQVFYSDSEGDIVLHSNTVRNKLRNYKGLCGSVPCIYECTVFVSGETYPRLEGRVKGQIVV